LFLDLETQLSSLADEKEDHADEKANLVLERNKKIKDCDIYLNELKKESESLKNKETMIT
jgi:hypothetical protein